MSDSSTMDEPDRKVQLEEYYFQRKILFGCTVGLFFGLLLWILAMSTNRWFIVSGPDVIFVEGPRRYFKSSHSGIWRNCRYAYSPVPVSASVVRNFTTLAASYEELPDVKSSIVKDDFFKKLQINKLPELSTIAENDFEFRKHLFAEWFDKNPADFDKLKEKFKEFQHDKTIENSVFINPSDYNEVLNAVGHLVSKVEYNTTHSLRVIVPEELRDALFEGWSDHGMKMMKVLYHYAKSLNIEPSIYHNGTKYMFRPPKPTKKLNKGVNGFNYNKWQKCTFTNLFADDDEIANDPSVDEDMLDLSRTAATFSVIALFVMILGFFFTIYTFLNPRYMFKRLAGGVHFIAALSTATVCRLLDVSMEHAKEHLNYAFPKPSDYDYGYGFFFGCFVSIINFFSCIMFFWYSRKRKGDKAATEELGMADEVIQIGR